MKKNYIFFCLLGLLPLGSSAQTVIVSPPVTLREETSYDIFGDDRGNVLLFRNKGTEFQVQGFDANLNLSWEKDVELDRKNPIIEGAVQAPGGGFNVIYQFRQRLMPILKIHRYSPASNLIDSVTIKEFEQSFVTPAFEVEFSEDKNVALVWSVKEQSYIHVIAFDMRQMKLLWEKTFSLENILFYRDYLQMLVDNRGNMYFINSRDNFPSRKREHFLDILDYGPDTDSLIRHYTVPLGENLSFDVKFAYDNLNRTLKAGGLYSEENSIKARGFYYVSIDQATTNHLLQFYPFDEEFVAVLSEKEKVRNLGITDASIEKIVMRTDGGIIIIGELVKEFQRGGANTGMYSRSGFRPVIDYYYDDVFLMALHPNGEMHWKNILHKKQYSQDDNGIYSSFFLAKTPSALRLVYNDEIKNENTVSEYVVRGNGEFDRNAVMSTERKDLQLRFRDAVQLSAYDFVVPSERRNRLKLVRISFKGEK